MLITELPIKVKVSKYLPICNNKHMIRQRSLILEVLFGPRFSPALELSLDDYCILLNGELIVSQSLYNKIGKLLSTVELEKQAAHNPL